MQYYLGIDPGRKGGLALIDEFRNLKYYQLMPYKKTGYDYGQIEELIVNLPEKTTVVIELKPGTMNKSASPTTSFGFHCGVLYGLFFCHHPVIVSPKEWKKEFEVFRHYKESRQDMKLRSIHAAEQIFKLSFKSTQDGPAEALLLAEYGRRHKL
jgi:hypothetical protein